MLVGISGLIGAGKDTFADFLVKNHNFEKISFAGSLKDTASVIFGWNREMLEGSTLSARKERDKPDHWWARKLDMPNFTPRYALQQLGTEVFREGFHQDIWILSLEHKIINNPGNYVISDMRFPNEIDMVKRLNGTTVCIQRGELPQWWNIAEKRFSEPDKADIYAKRLAEAGVHASEFSWVGSHFDYVLTNNESLDTLESVSTRLVEDLLAANPSN